MSSHLVLAAEYLALNLLTYWYFAVYSSLLKTLLKHFLKLRAEEERKSKVMK